MPLAPQRSAPPLYWQLLVIRLMRLTVQVALKSSVSLADLKKLLQIAIVQELRARGYTESAMSLLLGCSTRTVKEWSAQARKLEEVDMSSSPLRRILTALEQRPHTAAELARLIPQDDAFDDPRVALRLLKRHGLIEGEADGPLHLPAEARLREREHWEEALSGLERAYSSSLLVLREIARRPATAAQLNTRLRALGKTEIDPAIAFLQEVGLLRSRPVAALRTPQYALAPGVFRLLPPDPVARWRVGLLDLVEQLSLFLESFFEAPDLELLGNRGWMFRCRPEELTAFIRAHNETLRREISTLAGRAGDATGGGLSAIMTWFAAPLPSERDP